MAEQQMNFGEARAGQPDLVQPPLAPTIPQSTMETSVNDISASPALRSSLKSSGVASDAKSETLAPSRLRTSSTLSRPSKPTLDDDERRKLDLLASSIELRLTMSSSKFQTVFRGCPRHSAEPYEISEEFGDAAITGDTLDEEFQDTNLTEPSWWFLLHPTPSPSEPQLPDQETKIRTFTQEDLQHFMHVRYEKDTGATSNRRRLPRGPPLQGTIGCSLIYRTIPLPSSLYIPAPEPLNSPEAVASTKMEVTEPSTLESSSTTEVPPDLSPQSSIETNNMDIKSPKRHTEDLIIAKSFNDYGGVYESDDQIAEPDQIKKRTTTKTSTSIPSSNPTNKPSWHGVLRHDLLHPPQTIYELSSQPFKLKLNPPLSNIRKRMLTLEGTKLSAKPIRTVFHVDRSLVDESNDNLLVIFKHSVVEGVLLRVPFDSLPSEFKEIAQRVAMGLAEYHAKKLTRFQDQIETHYINSFAPAKHRLSSNSEEWDDDEYAEDALYPEQMTRKELRTELRKLGHDEFEGKSNTQLRQWLRELRGLAPDPQDELELPRMFKRWSVGLADSPEPSPRGDDTENPTPNGHNGGSTPRNAATSDNDAMVDEDDTGETDEDDDDDDDNDEDAHENNPEEEEDESEAGEEEDGLQRRKRKRGQGFTRRNSRRQTLTSSPPPYSKTLKSKKLASASTATKDEKSEKDNISETHSDGDSTASETPSDIEDPDFTKSLEHELGEDGLRRSTRKRKITSSPTGDLVKPFRRTSTKVTFLTVPNAWAPNETGNNTQSEESSGEDDSENENGMLIDEELSPDGSPLSQHRSIGKSRLKRKIAVVDKNRNVTRVLRSADVRQPQQPSSAQKRQARAKEREKRHEDRIAMELASAYEHTPGSRKRGWNGKLFYDGPRAHGLSDSYDKSEEESIDDFDMLGSNALLAFSAPLQKKAKTAEVDPVERQQDFQISPTMPSPTQQPLLSASMPSLPAEYGQHPALAHLMASNPNSAALAPMLAAHMPMMPGAFVLPPGISANPALLMELTQQLQPPTQLQLQHLQQLAQQSFHPLFSHASAPFGFPGSPSPHQLAMAHQLQMAAAVQQAAVLGAVSPTSLSASAPELRVTIPSNESIALSAPVPSQSPNGNAASSNGGVTGAMNVVSPTSSLATVAAPPTTTAVAPEVTDSSTRQPRPSRLAARNALAKYTKKEDSDEEFDMATVSSSRHSSKSGAAAAAASVGSSNTPLGARGASVTESAIMDLLSLSSPRATSSPSPPAVGSSGEDFSAYPGSSSSRKSGSTRGGRGGKLSSSSGTHRGGSMSTLPPQLNGLSQNEIREVLQRQQMAALPFIQAVSMPVDATAAQYANAMNQQHAAIMAALQAPSLSLTSNPGLFTSPFTPNMRFGTPLAANDNMDALRQHIQPEPQASQSDSSGDVKPMISS